MAKKLKDDQWYVVNVQVPGGQDVTAAEVQAFVDDLAKKLSNGDTEARKTKPAKDAPATDGQTVGVVPLYVCHGKF